MKDWERDKRWSDRFLPQIKAILGVHLIGEPPLEEDQERNTDLMVLRMDAVRIGCRVRKHQYLQAYGHEFTIRAGRPYGTKTELTKIIEGWGDYFFYGFADVEEQHLLQWFLGDLNVFRLWLSRWMTSHNGTIPGQRQANKDNSSHFRAFAVGALPSDFVIGRREDMPTLTTDWC